MIEYLYDQNGQYVKQLNGTAEEVIGATPIGYGTTNLPPPRATDYWNGSEWVNIGTKPKWYFEFDYDTKEWKDTRSLASVKVECWERVKLARNVLEFGGFLYNGSVYDSDQISQGRILAAYVFGQPTEWTTATDGVVELSADQVRELGYTMMAHVQSVHSRGRLARELIFASKSIEEAEAVIY